MIKKKIICPSCKSKNLKEVFNSEENEYICIDCKEHFVIAKGEVIQL